MMAIALEESKRMLLKLILEKTTSCAALPALEATTRAVSNMLLVPLVNAAPLNEGVAVTMVVNITVLFV